MVARVLRVAGERLALDGARSRTTPTFERAFVTGEPTVSDGSARRCVSETTTDGSLWGWMSMRAPCTRFASTKSVIPTTVPSTGA